MLCEVCGKKIEGQPYIALIEGAKLIVCNECARLASISWRLSKRRSKAKAVIKSRPLKAIKVSPPKKLGEDLEVIEGYGLIVKRAREKLGLSQEELGSLINEKASVIKRVESERMIPDTSLARKLEKALGVKLLIKPSELPLPSEFKVLRGGKPTLTLGDIAEIKRRER